MADPGVHKTAYGSHFASRRKADCDECKTAALRARVEELKGENKALKDMLTVERGWKDPIVAGRFDRARASVEIDLAKREG